MQRRMMLKGRIRLDEENRYMFSSTIYDGTPFEMAVRREELELNDDFTDEQQTVDGWLFVREEAKQGDRSYLTLPQPILRFGRQVTVRDLQLMPPHATISAFRPKSLKGNPVQA